VNPPTTDTGELLLVVELSPSCPTLFVPHAHSGDGGGLIVAIVTKADPFQTWNPAESNFITPVVVTPPVDNSKDLLLLTTLAEPIFSAMIYAAVNGFQAVPLKPYS
jgi:hypothetical protein